MFRLLAYLMLLATLLLLPLITGAMLAGRALTGQVLAYTAPGNTYRDVMLLDWRTRIHWRTGTRGSDLYPMWSPDGRRLAFLSMQGFPSRFVILEPGKRLYHLPELNLPLPHMVTEMEALWQENGTALLYMPPPANRHQSGPTPIYRVSIADAAVQQIDLDSHAAQSFLNRLSDMRQGSIHSPDGRYTLVIRYEDGHWILYRLDRQHGAETRVYDSGPTMNMQAYALSPGGRYAAVTLPPFFGPNLLVFDVQTGTRHAIHHDGVTNPTWQPRQP